MKKIAQKTRDIIAQANGKKLTVAQIMKTIKRFQGRDVTYIAMLPSLIINIKQIGDIYEVYLNGACIPSLCTFTLDN